MAKAIVLLWGVFLFITGCAGAANTNGGAQPAATQNVAADIRGQITIINRADSASANQGQIIGTVLIEGAREADTQVDRASVRVTRETRIFESQGSERRPASFDALKIGDRVEARFDGPVMESYPVQATAREVVILQAAASGGETAPGENEAAPNGAGGAGLRPEEAAEAAASAPAQFRGTAGSTERRRAVNGVVTLSTVRTGRHANFDRIVFEFSGASLPSYHIEYIDRPVRQCGSGDVVPLAGDGWLRVRMEPARAHTEEGQAMIPLSYRPRRVNHTIIKEIVSTCDFEAQVEWVLGVSSPNRYRVIELSNPSRLVVDVRH